MDDDMWLCHICTHCNEGLSRTCSMCNHSRPHSELPASLRRTTSSMSDQSDFDATDANDESAGSTGALRFLVLTILRLIAGILTCMLAIAGAFLGTIIGAIAGQTSDCGLFRGAGLGAVAGAVSTIEFTEALWACWQSEQTASRSSMAEVLENILSGIFIQQHVGPAMLLRDHHRWQVNIDNMSYEELYEMFGPGGGIKGASEVLMKNLPWHIIPEDGALDTLGERISCPICLEVHFPIWP
ncbi:hypothetical protein O6H91_19G054200 [Diphasiastrum complanatum]|uniref:Uncharacterized protein n=1 Tax=Diphasiastrum complanatum TaxID=34168 RepID=A0ACC2AVC4_DIPCM|nr:hypothetical protein O6H91_19G054200 [Diphasiastrum complanatum]